MIDREALSRLEFKKPYAWLATWFGCGLMRPAPGTWGTLGGLPIGIILVVLGGWPALLAGLIIVCAVGYWATEQFEKKTGLHDPGIIVIDEVAGVWLGMLPVILTPLNVVLVFAVFRFFDILKPWPVSWADKKLPGALGVMADDLVAGLYTALVMTGLRLAGLG